MKTVSKRALQVFCFVLLTAGYALAQHDHHEQHAERKTFVGRVVGSACYMSHGERGDDHRDCALECAKAGIPLAILDESSGTLYLPIAKNHHASANSELMTYVEKNVEVTGAVVEKNGMKAIMLESVEAP